MLSEYYQLIKRRGIGFIFSFFWNNILFDLIRGTDTFRRKQAFDYKKKPKDFEDGIYYVGIKTSTLRKVFKLLESICGTINHFHFFDLGCGKGKALLYYLEYVKDKNAIIPTGIEYDEQLVIIAKKNLKILRSENKAKILFDDARNFLNYTQSDRLIIYMYNPFNWKIMSEVIDKIKSSNIQQVVICYIDPVERQQIISAGFKELSYEKGKYPADNFSIFEYKKNHFPFV